MLPLFQGGDRLGMLVRQPPAASLLPSLWVQVKVLETGLIDLVQCGRQERDSVGSQALTFETMGFSQRKKSRLTQPQAPPREQHG